MQTAVETVVKDPGATLDYSFDWNPWLAGDTISVSSWEIPTGLTSPASSVTAGVATAWVAGGTEDKQYYVRNQVTTAAGRIDKRSILIKIHKR